ncbi:MAG: OmpA family protein [Aureispira sp.]|nr:OmpA family protein [Aureispira sp.]
MKRIQLLIILLFSQLSISYSQSNSTSTIYFAPTSHELSLSEQQKLTLVIEDLLSKTNLELEINLIGHTDNIGTLAENQLLSEQRVQTIHDYLVEKGISLDQIQSSLGKGENSPISSNTAATGRQQNRRVEILAKWNENTQLSLNIDSKNSNVSPIEDEEILIKENSVSEDRPAVFYGTQGTIVNVPKDAFENTSTSELVVEIKEVFSIEQAIINDWMTIDENGNGLVTNGMFQISFKNAQGKPVEPKKDIEILIPTDNIDPEIRLYDPVKQENRTAWKALNQKPSSTRRGNQNYYRVSGRGDLFKNLDKPDCLIVNSKRPLVVFKNRWKKTHKIYLSGKQRVVNTQPVSRGKFTSKRKFYTNLPYCVSTPLDQIWVFSQKKGQYYLANIPIETLKMRKRKNQRYYIIRKRDFEPLEIKSPLQEVYAQR